MTDSSCGSGTPGGLQTPTRNKYFYGKLLDVFHLEMEQRYGNRQRWLTNQLVGGSGTIVGLQVAVTEQNLLQVGPGAAVDGHGREIVVPAMSPVVDPRQPTDDCGRPKGDPFPDGTMVGLYLAYHECGAEYVPSAGSDCGCDSEPDCRPSTICERYRLLVGKIIPPDGGGSSCEIPGLWYYYEPPTVAADDETAEDQGIGSYGGLRFDHEVAEEYVTRPHDPPIDDGRILLASGYLFDGGIELVTGDRDLVYSNEFLLEAMICLAKYVKKPLEIGDTPVITSVSPWTDGEPLPLSAVVAEGLRVDFDRPLELPPGPPSGWFIVTIEYPEPIVGDNKAEQVAEQLVVRRLNAASIELVDDGWAAVFKVNPTLGEFLVDHYAPDEVLCRVVVKSHALIDEDGRALDGEFLGRDFSTGDDWPGGDFESWFVLRIRD